MEPREERWKNYERERRRLNVRLGLTVFALLPLPAIFIAVGLSPLRMLLAVATLSWSVGGRAAELGGLAFGVAAALLLAFSYFSDKRAEHEAAVRDPSRL